MEYAPLILSAVTALSMIVLVVFIISRSHVPARPENKEKAKSIEYLEREYNDLLKNQELFKSKIASIELRMSETEELVARNLKRMSTRAKRAEDKEELWLQAQQELEELNHHGENEQPETVYDGQTPLPFDARPKKLVRK